MEQFTFDRSGLEMIEQSPVPVAIYQYLDDKVNVIALTKGFCDLFGYESVEQAYSVMRSDMYTYVHASDAKRVSDAAYHFARGNGNFNVVFRARIFDEYHVIRTNADHIYPEPSVRLGVVWYFDEGPCSSEGDSTEIRLNQSSQTHILDENRSYDMNYDYMTGLPSMTYFFKLSEAYRDRMYATGIDPVMCYADLNGMRYFNNKYGFAEGSHLIRTFARVLAKHFGEKNCSRFGQDHFAFFTEKNNIEERLGALFEECKGMNGGRTLPVKVGIYMDSTGRVEASLACDRAKYACDIKSNEYHSYYIYFDDAMLAREIHRQYIMDNLDRAIENNWVHAYYQPIVRAANGKVCDEEALARWEDPVMGLFAPSDFVPILEDCKLIYKLDLHIVDLIIEKMKKQADAGLYVVPVSVNLSRTDFEACDIVEEIRKRVDEAGIDRGKLTVEITESVMGENFEYMKSQVERFQALGFHVWMDDFGSGYSSLDLLQDIKFDLIKMDMRFMKEFAHGEKSRIILSELIRMAVSLGIDTVTEGVETQEQMEFLREVGCTKLQGYYYSRPVPVSDILGKKRGSREIGFENPEESEYYAAMGRINLYDLSVIANDDNEGDNLGGYFDTIPMSVMEADDEGITIVRCNKSYRHFMERNFGIIVIGEKLEYSMLEQGDAFAFMNNVRNCVETDSRLFIKEKISNGMTVRSFIRSIGVNPVTGVRSFVVVVLEVIQE